YVSGIFELDAGGFRDKYVFSFRWQNFKGLSARFPEQPAGNFDVVLDAGKNFFTIAGMTKVDTAKLNEFLTDVSLLTVDRFAQPQELPDTASLKSLMEIVISDIAERKFTLKLFSDEQLNLVPGLSGKELVYFHPDKIRPILRPKSFFAKQ
ncbi:MAG TPA: hypothetical protein VEB86_19850, partial [Chryseosolibacter sp.]|nr:hypothetical protein [Chryseosolibacter sp.]